MNCHPDKPHVQIDPDKLTIAAGDNRLSMMNYACERLKAAGFTFIMASHRSEACYYALPGYNGLLRVALHKKGKWNDAIIQRPNLANITFGANNGHFSAEKTDSLIERAVGHYIMAHAPKPGSQKTTISDPQNPTRTQSHV